MNKSRQAEFHFCTCCPFELRWQEMKSMLVRKGLEVDITITINDDWTLLCAGLWLDVYECLTDGFNFLW